MAVIFFGGLYALNWIVRKWEGRLIVPVSLFLYIVLNVVSVFILTAHQTIQHPSHIQIVTEPTGETYYFASTKNGVLKYPWNEYQRRTGIDTNKFIIVTNSSVLLNMITDGPTEFLEQQ